ncbi:unnamed protein product [Prorocentrum cordatum]|uniref:Uncharacterized protein n=1 Tax=Prorocentrum cordatum TaxID=2364126 RepID=A0ABN9ULH2_9DINO|nr:unnamed protein product [Polarella glacialis]
MALAAAGVKQTLACAGQNGAEIWSGLLAPLLGNMPRPTGGTSSGNYRALLAKGCVLRLRLVPAHRKAGNQRAANCKANNARVPRRLAPSDRCLHVARSKGATDLTEKGPLLQLDAEIRARSRL